MDRLYPLTVTVPKATPVGTPFAVPWLLEDGTLRDVEIQIPSGHNGLTGIRILWSDQQVVPFGDLSWIIANDRVVKVSWSDYINARTIVVQGYNTDIFDHSFYLLATITDLPANGTLAAQGGSGAAILPPVVSAAPDPLSPQALIASLPPDIAVSMGIDQSASLT